MNLAKSKRSAFIMGASAVLSFAITSLLVNILIPYWNSRDIHAIIANPESLSTPGNLLALIGVVIFLLVLLTGLAAYWLYRFFGEDYYGTRGVWRWALFGFFLALLLQIPTWLFNEHLKFLTLPWQILSVFIAFFGARVIVPKKAVTPRH